MDAAPPPAATSFPARLRLEAARAQGLRYGENPHQTAAFYRAGGRRASASRAAAQLHGPELGYNNLLDWSAALGLLLEFDDPAAVVIKHTNPCGVALGRTVGEAMRRAKACDPVSIYGGIVGVNRRARHGGREGAVRHPPRDPLRARPTSRTRSRSCGATKKKCRVFQLPCARADYPSRAARSTAACSAACSSRTRT